MFSKMRMLVAVLVVVALTGAAGCGGGPTPNTGAIEGWVYAHADARDGAPDSDAPDMILLPRRAGAKHVPIGYVPLQGASVSVGGTTKVATTDSNGYFYIGGLAPGTYTVYIVHQRFITGFKVSGVTVVAGRTTVVVDDMALGSFFYLNIGISNYWNYSHLNYCDDDAKAMTDALYVNNYFAGDFEELIDGEATKEKIRNAIASIGSKMTRFDVFVMYFSGHGGQEEDSAETDPYDDFIEYICPVDTTPAGTGVSISSVITDQELAAWIRDYIPSDATKVVMFDSCFAGGMSRSDGAITPVPAGRWMSGMARNLVDSGTVVLAASADNEESLEYGEPINHGIFTYCLLQGLGLLEESGDVRCDVNHDGYVTVEELFNYASPLVQSYTGGLQHPQIYLNPLDLKDQVMYRQAGVN